MSCQSPLVITSPSFPLLASVKHFSMKAAFALTFYLLASPAHATEVQRHGLSFEHWVADTFFGGHRPTGLRKQEARQDLGESQSHAIRRAGPAR
jgi:hypothetical protein